MEPKLADQVRKIALKKYVEPARKAGATDLSISVKDLLKDLESMDFPLNYTPLVCNSIKTKAFQRENHLRVTRVDGPKSQTGTRVVVHYRLEDALSPIDNTGSENVTQTESPAERALRLTNQLRGLLRREIAEKGGAEGFIRWVRSDDKDAA